LNHAEALAFCADPKNEGNMFADQNRRINACADGGIDRPHWYIYTDGSGNHDDTDTITATTGRVVMIERGLFGPFHPFYSPNNDSPSVALSNFKDIKRHRSCFG